jgi:hypothetical protein
MTPEYILIINCESKSQADFDNLSPDTFLDNHLKVFYDTSQCHFLSAKGRYVFSLKDDDPVIEGLLSESLQFVVALGISSYEMSIINEYCVQETKRLHALKKEGQTVVPNMIKQTIHERLGIILRKYAFKIHSAVVTLPGTTALTLNWVDFKPIVDDIAPSRAEIADVFFDSPKIFGVTSEYSQSTILDSIIAGGSSPKLPGIIRRVETPPVSDRSIPKTEIDETEHPQQRRCCFCCMKPW